MFGDQPLSSQQSQKLNWLIFGSIAGSIAAGVYAHKKGHSVALFAIGGLIAGGFISGQIANSVVK